MAADEKVPGIELRHELRGHEGRVTSLSWSPDGRLLASAATDHTIRVWDLTADLEHRIIARYEGTGARVAWSPDGAILASSPYLGQVVRHSVATWSTLGSSEGAEQGTWLSWSPDGAYLASGQQDGSITFWTDEDDFSTPYSTFKIDDSAVHQVAWHPSQQLLASGSLRGDVQLWTWPSPLVTMLKGHSGQVYSVAWSPDGRELASASEDCTLRIWDESGTPLRTLEGHTNPVVATAFSPCGRLLASRGDDGVRLWRRDTWEALTHITEPASSWTGVMAFHPRLALLAVESGNDIHVWALDPDRLLEATPVTSSVSYTTAKVVLVGDSGVGKTGLGWRLAHGSFKEQASTHGQQFWVLDSLGATRDDGTECEAVLWDLAGQPDYRLIHALFLDDAELALVLFDPTEHSEPLRGADYWLKALATRPGGPGRSILVGARIDRGEPTLTDDQILAFCGDRAVSGGYLLTSAATGVGLDDLVARMRDQVAWERMPATVTTTTFKRIKEFALSLKEDEQVILGPEALRRRLEATDPAWKFTDDELTTAVGHLAKHGYVQILRTATGERRILLRPEVLNQLASSIVLEARRNPKGLGAVDEAMLRRGQYSFPELNGLALDERDVLLDAAVVLFLEHNLCFREWVGPQALLIFPELINRKRPPTEGAAMVDDVSYTVKGQVANVYAALVVLLGNTNTFTRTEQWQAQAQYEVGAGEVCGFRQVAEREGEIDLVLSYGAAASTPTRLIFQGLFERILLGRRVVVTRYPPLDCPQCDYRQERSEVVRRTLEGRGFLFCSNCGAMSVIPPAEELGPSAEAAGAVDEQATTAARRTGYETALAQLDGLVRTWDRKPKRLFVSYAWGVAADERWVERRLAWDLRHAGIDVLLDRWDNAQPGASVARFVSQISECELVVVVGTPIYRDKYENKVSSTGSVVAAEVDLIDQRLLGTEEEKRTVLPVLLDGEDRASLPPLLLGRVYADFRREDSYFASLFDLVLAVHGVPFDDEAVIDLRKALRRDALGHRKGQEILGPTREA